MAPDPPRNTPAASLSFGVSGLKHPLQPDLWVAALCHPISLGPDPCGVQVPNLGGKGGDLATWTRAEVRGDAGSIHHGTPRAVASWTGFGRISCPTLVTARDPPSIPLQAGAAGPPASWRRGQASLERSQALCPSCPRSWHRAALPPAAARPPAPTCAQLLPAQPPDPPVGQHPLGSGWAELGGGMAAPTRHRATRAG